VEANVSKEAAVRVCVLLEFCVKLAMQALVLLCWQGLTMHAAYIYTHIEEYPKTPYDLALALAVVASRPDG